MPDDLIKAALDAAKEPPAREDGLLNGAGWPFRLTRNGVERRDESGDAPRWESLAPPLEIEADTRDGESRNWGRLVAFKDRDGRRHELALPMAELTRGAQGEVISRLADAGYEPPISAKGKAQLLAYISEARPGRRLIAAERLGWSGDSYVLPHRSIAPPGAAALVFQPSGGAMPAHGLDERGTLDDWREGVAALALGNSRLTLALSMAFAGPLLDAMNMEGGGVHLRGGSSLGKTTALLVGASVWGGRAFLQSWRATANGLEGVAALRNDGLLCLDELGECDARAAGEAAYMLANGVGKARAGRTGAARAPQRWRLMFLSTGEISLADKIGEEGRGKQPRAGQELRLLELPADAGQEMGLFEDLHGSPDAASFARRLKQGAETAHGTAAPAFLEALARDKARAAELIRGWTRGFWTPAPGDSGQSIRAAERFALIGAAGELAGFYGVLPWPKGAAITAARRCFGDWLKARGGTGAAEERAALAQARGFLEAHGASRFQRIDGAGERVINRAGFWRDTESGGREYLVLPEAFKGELARGHDAKIMAEVLAARGALVKGKDGRSTQSIHVSAEGHTLRLYVIRPQMLEADDAAL